MSAEEVQKKFTTTHGNWWEGWNEPGEPGGYGDKMLFEFEKMYWEGTVQDVYDELSGRPHVDIHGSKDFRKWKIEYKKRLKGWNIMGYRLLFKVTSDNCSEAYILADRVHWSYQDISEKYHQAVHVETEWLTNFIN